MKLFLFQYEKIELELVKDGGRESFQPYTTSCMSHMGPVFSKMLEYMEENICKLKNYLKGAQEAFSKIPEFIEKCEKSH